MSSIKDLVTLGFPWDGYDPFLFTVHHVDHYPAGNDVLGPAVSLRSIPAAVCCRGRPLI